MLHQGAIDDAFRLEPASLPIPDIDGPDVGRRGFRQAARRIADHAVDNLQRG